MVNPYRDLPDAAFWKKGVAEADPAAIYPIRAKRFTMEPHAEITTAGSCFAQELGKYIARTENLNLLIAEPVAEGQPLFSALYGNIYTVEQLNQLFDRAVNDWEPQEQAWQRQDGRYVDPFRPYIFPAGFDTPQQVIEARSRHFRAVRRAFSECAVFVFTLGLTESWRCKQDGAVLPVAPGVVTDHIDPSRYEFHNFTYREVAEGLRKFISRLQEVNPRVRVILTVSPVPLIATYAGEHVLVATTYSKSALRTACSEIENEFACAYYFPSYEIITGAHTRGRYYNPNLRTVTQAGVDQVMETFRRTYMDAASATPTARPAAADAVSALAEADDGESQPVCDEEEIVRSIGF